MTSFRYLVDRISSEKESGQMLYIFNSAFRPLYRENVINTLSLPAGVINTYQYSLSSNTKCYIDESAMPIRAGAGLEVMVIFIDRAIPDDFKFIPLRRGTLVRCYESESIIYYEVKMHEICAIVKSVDDFTRFIKDCFGDLLFNKSESGVETGYFAFQHDVSVKEYTFESETSWRKNVELVAKTAEFKKIFPVFTKFSLLRSDGKTQVKIMSRKNQSCFKLFTNRQYVAVVDYFLPDSDIDPDTAWLDLKIGVVPDYLSNAIPNRVLGTKAGIAKFAFSIPSVCNNCELMYQSSKHEASNKRIVFSTRPIPFVVKRSLWRWISITFCVIFLLASSVLKDFKSAEVLKDISEKINSGEVLAWYDNMQFIMACFLDKIKAFYPAVMNLLITGLTFLLVILLGKKDK